MVCVTPVHPTQTVLCRSIESLADGEERISRRNDDAVRNCMVVGTKKVQGGQFSRTLGQAFRRLTTPLRPFYFRSICSLYLVYERLCSILCSYRTSTARTLSRILVSDTLSWNRTLIKLSVATRWYSPMRAPCFIKSAPNGCLRRTTSLRAPVSLSTGAYTGVGSRVRPRERRGVVIGVFVREFFIIPKLPIGKLLLVITI